ncbi:MAG: hypothetical protein HRU11_05515, partial [Parvularculaceae bacterium]|nr:hypothetical protein [Parvularculaceae bacterium]
MKNRAIYTILAALSMVGISQGSAQDVDSSTDEVGTSISLSRTDELPTGYQWFDESLSLKRGTLAPLGEEAILVNDEAMCEISEREWGWYAGDCLSTDQLILQVSDTIDWVRIEKPSYLGHVTFGGWGLDEQRRLIERIETQLEEKANFTPPQWDDLAIAEHWRVEPTLNEEAKLLYFATSDMLSNEPGPLV